MSTTPYKYFAYKDGKYWRVNELLPVPQIRSMLQALEWRHEVFASIQTYDEYGNIVSSPFFFDFDGQPDQVLAETRHFVQACEFLINVTPRIYFSGNKGFHLIIEKDIPSPRCHELVKSAALELGPNLVTLDPKVYRTRSMFRIPGSPASRKGYYKIELTRRELFDQSFDSIRDLATTQRMIQTEHDPSKFDESQFQDWLEIETAKLPQYNSLESIRRVAQSVDMEITPCIASMLTKPSMGGERNAVIYTLARFFRSCHLDEQSALKAILHYDHHKAFEAEGREVSKVVRSTYRSQNDAMVGCKSNSSYAMAMRERCDSLCHFRDDFVHEPWAPETNPPTAPQATPPPPTKETDLPCEF